eukprot:04470.XXX_18510_25419_1 [CDS] Oithona nana genome sequencing.
MLGALYPPETTTVDPEQEESSEEPPAPETKPEIVKNLPGKRTAALFLSSDEDPDFIAIGENLRVFFETTEAEKHPGFLCPDYPGFLGITEKYFYDSLTSVLEDPNVDCSAPKILLTEPKNEQTTQKTAIQHEQQQNDSNPAEQNGESDPDQQVQPEPEQPDSSNEHNLIEDDPEQARKALLVFPDDTKDYIQSEMAENELKILGSCTVKLNQQKATLLVKKRRKLVDLPEEEEHKLLVDLSHLDAFAAIIKRETDKEERDKQNAVIKELDPLIFTLHLGSMKIFFSNIETEEKTVDGEVLGELDQGYSSGEEADEEPP